MTGKILFAVIAVGLAFAVMVIVMAVLMADNYEETEAYFEEDESASKK